jgi:dsDNA-specific endonuclease/ATPase MutS2
MKVPVTIDYSELEDQIKRQSANEFTNLAERVKKSANELKRIPAVLKRLSALLLVEDFVGGVRQFIDEGGSYPSYSNNLHLSNAKNMFLTNAQPISFQLDSFSRCSILTGANSGGKTTLLEHVLQNISLFQMGLPISGEVHMPIFTEVYYFAKNKGSASKGAFETLLTQMSKIKPGKQTLILADEIEAVTEPGVAGKIISATADYFIKRNCFMILATHLGYEIAKSLPQGARIDGIEAKGLDSNFNLIVDHNPVMGRLAHSTPELIVEMMANAHQGEYFEWLNAMLKKG